MTYTREQLTAMTQEEFNTLSPEEQLEVRRQGRAFMEKERLQTK